mgnify:CR=1 FL=1
MDPGDADTYHCLIERHPEWGYLEVVAALKQSWLGPDQLTQFQELKAIKYEPNRENYWQFCIRLRKAYFTAHGRRANIDSPDLIISAITHAPAPAQAAAGAHYGLSDGTLNTDVGFYEVARFLARHCMDNNTPASQDQPPPIAPVTVPPTDSAGPSSATPLLDATCFTCGGRGHLSRDCPSPPLARQKRRRGKPGPIQKPRDDRRTRRMKGTITKLRKDIAALQALAHTPAAPTTTEKTETQGTDASVKQLADRLLDYLQKN